MEPNRGSRRPENAATDKTAGPGGNDVKGPAGGGPAQAGAPRSWRQYIEQNAPAQTAGAGAEQKNAGVRRSAPGVKARTRTAWERFVRRTVRWARESGGKARAAAVACREKLEPAAAACREKLGAAAAACGEKMSAAAAVCREKLGPVAAACGRKLGAAAVCREKLGPVAAACREKLEPAAAVCREKLGPGVEKFRRGAGKVRTAVARHPISPLLYVTLLAVVIGVAAFQGNYARAYVLEVNGQKVGLVTGADEANAILSSVELRAASILGDDFDYEVNVTLSPVYAAPGDLTDAAEMEDALFEGMGAYVTTASYAAETGKSYMTAWALSVDGVELGRAAGRDALYRLLDELAQPYLPENAVRYGFVEDVQIYPVQMPSDAQFEDLEPIREELSALRVEEAVYTVKEGNTFNAIAYSLGMKPNDLAALNPDVIVDELSIDQQLVIQQAVPQLSVVAVTDETYEEVIPSPVEYIGTADLYVGSTKLKEQGQSGLALVNAQVTYINNVEVDREVLESTTLKEPTTTYTYTGTTPRPTTASNGYFIWPVQGTITSTFGYRYIFGSTSYHSGLDIACPHGTTIKAADGGKVTFAGDRGDYGYLVIILHDDGKQTCYAHNSALLVKAGDRVYQGQAIARAGSTGLATGPHCHFEIRVNGTCVNPLNYLS